MLLLTPEGAIPWSAHKETFYNSQNKHIEPWKPLGLLAPDWHLATVSSPACRRFAEKQQNQLQPVLQFLTSKHSSI